MSQNERMDGGRYNYKVTTASNPMRPGRNRTDDWSGPLEVGPGTTVREALDWIVANVAKQQGVRPSAIQVLQFSFWKA